MRMAATQSRLLAVLGVLTMAGCCCCGSGFQEAVQETANQATSLLNVTQLTKAVVAYKKENGEWPESLEDVRDKVPNFDTVMINPITKSNPGYAYVKPSQTDPSYDTVIIYQLRDGAHDATLAKGYANGSIGTSPTQMGGTTDETNVEKKDETSVEKTDDKTDETKETATPDSSTNETDQNKP